MIEPDSKATEKRCPRCHRLRAVNVRYDGDGKRQCDPCPVCKPVVETTTLAAAPWPLDLDALRDKAAVAIFSRAMIDKMAASRAKGRGGWQTCPVDVLWRMLREHVEKGDPRDVACLAMMIWHNQQREHERAGQ